MDRVIVAKGKQIKVKKNIEMPLLHETADGKLMTLQGFIRHDGSADGGHYIAYLQQEGKYYKVSDSQKISIKETAYLTAAKQFTLALYAEVKEDASTTPPLTPRAVHIDVSDSESDDDLKPNNLKL